MWFDKYNKLSVDTKNFLTNFKLTENDMTTIDYFMLLKENENKRYDLARIIPELNKYGFLLSLSGEETISNMDMSTRLKNCLERNSILYLSELKNYTLREVKKIRNLGEVTVKELISLCSLHNIDFYVMPPLPNFWKNSMRYQKYEKIFGKAQIKSISDFNEMTTSELYSICSEDFDHAVTIYNFLKKSNIHPRRSNPPFTFEYFNMKDAKKLALIGIYYMDAVVECFGVYPYSRDKPSHRMNVIRLSTIEKKLKQYLDDTIK